MKIIDERETWIHTNLVVDSFFISPKEQNIISMQIEPEIRQLGIQYGLHYEKMPDEENSRIVLECIPLEDVKQKIKELINQTIKDFPSRRKGERNVVTKITVEEPE
jgi:hypothetical protein